MNRLFTIGVLCLWLGIPLWNSVLAAETGAVTIQVSESSHVDGDEIFLGDIAQVQASPFLKEILEAISFGRSPRPGKIKTISRSQFLSKIRSRQALPKEISVLMPDKIYVKRASQKIDRTAVQNQVNLFLDDHFANRDYELESIRLKESDLYPAGQLEMVLLPPQRVNKNGKLSLTMDVLVDGEKKDTIRISGRVALYDTVACAARNLLKGETILETDVILVRKNIFKFRYPVVTSVQLLDGKILKTDVPKNSVIKQTWLKTLPMIQKGDVVTLVARKHNLLIVTSGISKEDGFKNKLIRVENIGSGKVMRGLVIEESRVEIIY